MKTVEFLVAWEDNTWTTETEEIPSEIGTLIGTEDFEPAVLAWAHSISGLISRTTYSSAVMFAIYGYSMDDLY